jgi:hypothetical protein
MIIMPGFDRAVCGWFRHLPTARHQCLVCDVEFDEDEKPRAWAVTTTTFGSQLSGICGGCVGAADFAERVETALRREGIHVRVGWWGSLVLTKGKA